MRITKWIGLLLCVPVMATAGDLIIEGGGKTQGFTRFWEDYERCKAREEFTPVRGEYETQEEYRRRVELLRVGCDTFRRIENAYIDVAVSLSYEVDEARFLFALPMTRGLRIQYDTLVWDDFPKFIMKLPRDRWHVDDPTPKASTYKECTLRNASANKAFISKIEPYRMNSWRGCMTYYSQSDEIGWRREEGAFFINDVTFYAYADIGAARRIRDMEKNLVYRIEGTLLVPEQSFEARRVTVLNKSSGDRLIELKP